jgi:hypothetical protein
MRGIDPPFPGDSVAYLASKHTHNALPLAICPEIAYTAIVVFLSLLCFWDTAARFRSGRPLLPPGVAAIQNQMNTLHAQLVPGEKGSYAQT